MTPFDCADKLKARAAWFGHRKPRTDSNAYDPPTDKLIPTLLPLDGGQTVASDEQLAADSQVYVWLLDVNVSCSFALSSPKPDCVMTCVASPTVAWQALVASTQRLP